MSLVRDINIQDRAMLIVLRWFERCGADLRWWQGIKLWDKRHDLEDAIASELRLIRIEAVVLESNLSMTTYPMGTDMVTVFHDKPLVDVLGRELLEAIKKRSTEMSLK